MVNNRRIIESVIMFSNSIEPFVICLEVQLYYTLVSYSCDLNQGLV